MAILDFLPSDLKTQLRDNLVQFLAHQADKVVGEQLGDKIRKLSSEGGFLDAFDKALRAGTDRFVAEYTPIDEDLVAAIAADHTFWQSAPVRQALIKLISRPGAWLTEERDTVAQHFADVLPTRVNRARVDKAVTYCLQCVAEELWTLPGAREVREVYRIKLEQYTAETLRQQVAVQQAQLRMLEGLSAGMREALLQLTDGLAQQRLLPAADKTLQPDALAKPKVFHNLPQPDYGCFVGREAELARVRTLLSPTERAWIIVIDGIGGIGKSSLALEVAHECILQVNDLPEDQRFKAVVWTSAKAEVLTADGIAPRQQITRTLSDVYTAIALVLEREDITRASRAEQDALVRQALTQQRTLLIVDNMESIDDEQLNAFLRELPLPTKCIVTTRHRIDMAYPIRLQALPRRDALNLIAQECEKKSVTFKAAEADRLYRLTGGVPLALVWSIAQMGFGADIEAVLRRIGDAEGDIARYCFQSALVLIRERPAHHLLLALAIFDRDANRQALGVIADLSMVDREEGLVQLERLSLVNKRADRFALLPLTLTFARRELTRDPVTEAQLRRRWIDYLKEITRAANSEYYWRYGSYAFHDEGENILDAVEWCFAYGSADDVFALTAAAYDYMEVVGRWNEILDSCRRALDLAVSVQNLRAGARLANIIGWVLSQKGDYDEAEHLFQNALIWYKSAANLEGEVVALQHLGIIYRKRRDFDAAQAWIDQARRLADELGNGDLTAWIIAEYGKLARDRHDWTAAWDYFVVVRDWFEQRAEQTPRDEPLARSTWGHLAIVAYQLGRPQEAKDLCLRSLEFFEVRGTKGYMATLKYRLALAEEALGEREAALKHVKEAMEWFERLGMRPDYAEALKLLDQLQTVEAR